MKRFYKTTLLTIGLLFFMGGAVFAQKPRFTDAKLVDHSAAAGLEREFRTLVASQGMAAWIGYGVPMVPGDRQLGCCFYQLEGNRIRNTTYSENGKVKLENGINMFVLFRVEQGQVQKIRTFEDECELDAGGLSMIWLSDVRPEESVILLASFASIQDKDDHIDKRLVDSAITAIALHKDPSADQYLEQLIQPNQPELLREKASFWLGAARGKHGFEVLRQMIKKDPSEHIREKMVSALNISKEPEAVDSLIEAARGDSSAHVRSQAIFWLSQKAGSKSGSAIASAVENDPDIEVKKKAVFALSRLPKDEGIPKLIGVARANRNSAVRKQAMFWLGQSKDPRALDFFEQILK